MRALLLPMLLLFGCSQSLPADKASNAAVVRPVAATIDPAAAPDAGNNDGVVETAAGEGAAVTRLPAPGSISGDILFPDNAVPAMRVCAIHDGGDLYGCVQTAVGASRYRIEQLPPTSYRVVAKPQTGALRIGGFVKQVQCLRAPCPAVLMPVNVAPGEAIAGVDLNGFYRDRKDFPALPADAK
jgi:hypothetical protein